jgi:hypothetical protein
VCPLTKKLLINSDNGELIVLLECYCICLESSFFFGLIFQMRMTRMTMFLSFWPCVTLSHDGYTIQFSLTMIYRTKP